MKEYFSGGGEYAKDGFEYDNIHQTGDRAGEKVERAHWQHCEGHTYEHCMQENTHTHNKWTKRKDW